MHLYLATDLRPADGERLTPDEDEHLLLERLPWRDAVAAAERGELRDGKTIVGLLWLARLRGGDVDAARAARRLRRGAPARSRYSVVFGLSATASRRWVPASAAGRAA